MLLSRVWHAAKRAYTRTIDRYADLLERRPYATQCTTSAALWGLGDIGAQSVESSYLASVSDGEEENSTDWRRVGLITVYGGAFVGPLGHAWYEGLDKAARSVCRAGTMRFIAVKILGDTVLFGPVHVASFFGIVGLAERESLDEVTERMRTDYFPTLLAESIAWPAVQGFNFWLVPVRHQLLVVNIVSLADCTFLSFVKHQGDVNGGAWQRFVAEAKALQWAAGDDCDQASVIAGIAAASAAAARPPVSALAQKSAAGVSTAGERGGRRGSSAQQQQPAASAPAEAKSSIGGKRPSAAAGATHQRGGPTLPGSPSRGTASRGGRGVVAAGARGC